MHGLRYVMPFYLFIDWLIDWFTNLFSACLFIFLYIYVFICLFFILIKESLAEEMIARFSLNKVCYECSLHYTHEQPVAVGFNFFYYIT